MFTKKTRVLSALLTVCMLISMLACFVVPVSATTGTPGEGLVDVSSLPDIKDLESYGNADAGKKYKITDRAGLENLAQLTAVYKNNFTGFTFYLANDIDMEWVNFVGIASGNDSAEGGENGHYALKATFDGNGFVIKNLLMYQPNRARVGFIDFFYGGDGAEIRNLGIANGLIIGGSSGTYTGAGSIVGEFWHGRMENCWSAATVITLNNGAVGGLVGTASRNVAEKDAYIKNSYFLGSVKGNNAEMTGGLYGAATNTKFITSNCYVYGDGKDAAALNSGLAATVSGYDVKFVDSSEGYPVLTYYKSGETTPYIQRLPDTTGNLTGAGLGNELRSGLYLTLNDRGIIECGNEANAVYKLTVKRVCAGIEVDSASSYCQAGSKFTVPAVEGYELIDAAEGFVVGAEATMPAGNLELIYSGIHFDVIRNIKARYADYNPDYFEDHAGAALQKLIAACDVILAEEAKPEAERDLALINAQGEIIAAADKTLSEAGLLASLWTDFTEDELHRIPRYTEYDLYKDYGVRAWAVSTKEDWIALTEAGTAVANYHIYITANIDFDKQNMKPLCAGAEFNGSVNGMGHYFENLLIRHAATDGSSGAALISRVGANAYIAELGIKSGLIELTGNTSSDNWYGLAVFAGRSGTSAATEASAAATFFKCWAGKDVKLRTYSPVDTGYSTFVARGGAHIESCYSMVTLENELLVYGALSGWTQLSTTIRNSYVKFNGVTPTHGFELARCGRAPNEDRLENVYSLGGSSGALAGNNFGALDEDTSAAELAYLLNTNYAKDRGEGAKVPERVYWTVDDEGNVVFGTKDDKVLRLTVNANGNLYYSYGMPGDTVNLDLLIGATDVEYKLSSGDGATLEDNIATFGDTDVEVEVTSLMRNVLDQAMALYAGKDLSYFADPDAISAKLELVTGRTYVSQDSINRDALDLANLYVPAADKAFPISYGVEGFNIGTVSIESFDPVGNDAFPLVGINNEDDLLTAAARSTEFTAKQTLALNTSIDLTGSAFTTIPDLKASFDGQGHTISKYSANAPAFFQNFKGAFLGNLTFDDCDLTNGYGDAALVVNAYNGSALKMENITIVNCDIVKDSSKSGTGNGYGFLLGTSNAAGTVKNIVLKNNTISGDKGNVGFITGPFRGAVNVLFENIEVVNNEFVGAFGLRNVSYLFGASKNANGKADLIVRNLVVAGNKGAAINGALIGDHFSKVASTATADSNKLTVENALVYDNAAAALLGFRTTNATNKQGNIFLENVYSDNGLVNDAVLGNGKPITDYSDGVTVVTAGAVITGEKVYELNTKNSVDFALLSDGVATLADEANKAPVKVTVGNSVYYTDAEGKLIADADEINGLTDCSFSVEDIVNHSFTADTEVAILSHSYNTATPAENGKHTGECANCGDLSESECAASAGYTVEDYSDLEIKSAKLHKCAVCKNEWKTDVVMNPATLHANESFSAPTGKTVSVPVSMINNPGVTEMSFAVNYDPAALEYAGIEFMDTSSNGNVVPGEGKVEVTLEDADGAALDANSNGILFAVNFKVKEDAAAGETSVTIDFISAAIATETLNEFGDMTAKLSVYDSSNTGDFDKSGSVEVTDATQMLKYLLGQLEEGTYDLQYGDMNYDGKIDLLDVVELLHLKSAQP